MADAEWCHQLKYDISCTASEISSLTTLSRESSSIAHEESQGISPSNTQNCCGIL